MQLIVNLTVDTNTGTDTVLYTTVVQQDSDTERCLFMFDAKGAWLLIRPG